MHFESYEYLVLKGMLDLALHGAYFFVLLLVGSIGLFVGEIRFLTLLRIGWGCERHECSEHR